MSEKKAMIAAFVNQKGGVSKSTLTSILANYIHLHTDYTVCVVDSDRQGTINKQRKKDFNKAFAQYIADHLVDFVGQEQFQEIKECPQDFLEDYEIVETLNPAAEDASKFKYTESQKEKLFKAFAFKFGRNNLNKLPEQVKEEIRNQFDFYNLLSVTPSDMPSVLNQIQDKFDIILIDLPGTFHEMGILDVYKYIDCYFIPFNLTEQDMDALEETFVFVYTQMLPMRKGLDFETEIYGILSKVNRKTIRYKEFVKDVKAGIRPRLFSNNEALNNIMEKNKIYLKMLENDIEYNEITFGQEFSTIEDYTNRKGNDYSKYAIEVLQKILG